MEYRLEVYASGGRNQDDCIKVFTSTAPFTPLHIGDLLERRVGDTRERRFSES